MTNLSNRSENAKVLSKTEIKTLSRYEVHLKRAMDGYVKGIYTSDLNVLEPIYNKLGHQLENRHCATCVLGMMTLLANEYFNTKITNNNNEK